MPFNVPSKKEIYFFKFCLFSGTLTLKVVPGGRHDKIFGVKFETVKLIGGR